MISPNMLLAPAAQNHIQKNPPTAARRVEHAQSNSTGAAQSASSTLTPAVGYAWCMMPWPILFEHNRWAMRTLLAACGPLSPQQLDQPFEMGPGSVRKTLL